MFPDQAALVGKTVYVPYVLPTTDKLADAYVAKVKQPARFCSATMVWSRRDAILREAYYRTEVVEESAKIYFDRQGDREPKVLTKEEFEEIASLESEAYRIQLLQKMK